MHTQDSMLIPMWRCREAFKMCERPRFLSYLPLSHVAEQQAVWIQSMLHGGVITFNEALPRLLRNIVEAKPTFFFGAPRVWEQLQQYVRAGSVHRKPWTIDNGTLTPSLKLRRPRVESRYGERVESLTRKAAQRGEVLVGWE